MKRTNKRINLISKVTSSILAALILSTSLLVSQYDMAAYWTKKTKTVILDGLSLLHTETLSSSGWLNINTIDVDLTKQNLSAGVITGADSVGKTKTLPTFLSSGKAVAATNASFFAYSDTDKRFTACGIVVENGEIMSCRPISENYFKQFAHVVIAKNNTVSIEYFTPYLYVMDSKGKTYKINRYNNAYGGTETITMQDAKYTNKSPGNTAFKNVTELVVQDGKMTSLRENQAPVTISKNMFVLTSKGSGAETLKKIFVKGEKLTFNSLTKPPSTSPSLPTQSPTVTAKAASTTSPAADVTSKPTQSPKPDATPLPGQKFSDFKAVIPGGGMLVNKGKALTSFSHVPTGSTASTLNPRTALGISQDGKKIFMVTVDGRQNESTGMSMIDLATMMVNQGAYYAINFDGGSSTAMVYKNPANSKNQLANLPYGTPTVINAFGIFSASDKSLNSINFTSSRTMFLRNVPIGLSLKGWDSAFGKVNIDKSKIKWSVEGVKGTFKSNVFKPTAVGSGKIKATYLNKSVTKAITVTPAPVSLTFNTNKLIAKPKSNHTLNAVVKNRNGFTSPIHSSGLTWKQSGKIGAVSTLGKFTASSNAASKGYISASLGKLKCYLPVIIQGNQMPLIGSVKLPKSSVYNNIWNKKPASGSTKIFVTQNTLSAFTASQTRLLNAFTMHANANAKYLTSIGSTPKAFDTGYNKSLIKVNAGYKQYSVGNASLVKLDTSKKSLYSYNPKQWPFLTSALSQNKTKLLIMRSWTGNWLNKTEVSAFKSQLLDSSIKTGKLNWVIRPGSKPAQKVVNGILTITVPPLFYKNKCNYLEISVKKGVANFQFKTIS